MLTVREWNERIDTFIREENEKAGTVMPVHRIFCQDDSDRSGGGLYNETVTVDTIGRFARALGDSNPLYSDPHYAESSVMRGIVAPPLIECCICSTFIGGRMPRLRGLQVFDAGTKWERFVPIRPGDCFRAETAYLGIEEITKSGADSRLLRRNHAVRLFNQNNELVSLVTARSLIRCAAPVPGESAAAGERSGERVDQADRTILECRPRYSMEQLEEVYDNLDAQLRGDFRRGGEVRHWEAVEIGEALPREIMGPYDESDGNSLMAAIGAANAFATKWAAIRGRRKNEIVDPETGALRHPIDRHSSDAVARAQGSPRAIVYGLHSQSLLGKLAGDWMGDAGMLRSLDCRCKKPVYYGDLSVQTGTVTGKYEENGRYLVTLRLQAMRQDGVVHTDADAVVELPI